MTEARLNIPLEKFLHQNAGEVIDIIEGCLIDNLLIATRRGYMALLETYVNCWTSEHTMYFSTDYNEICDVWESVRI